MSVIIRLQNLPWSAASADIRRFFKGMTIPDGGVHIVGGDDGDAFIAFATDEDARQAMRLTGEPLNGVPVKLFLSSRSEMQSVINVARGGSQPPAPQQSTPPPAIPLANLSQLHIPANLQGINFNQLTQGQTMAPSSLQPPQSQASAVPSLQQLGVTSPNQPSSQQLDQIAQLLSTPQAIQLQNQLGLNLAGLLGQTIPASQNQPAPPTSQPVTAPFNSSSSFPPVGQGQDSGKISGQTLGSSRWDQPGDDRSRETMSRERSTDRRDFRESSQDQRMRDDNQFDFERRDNRPRHDEGMEWNRFDRGPLPDRIPPDNRAPVHEGRGTSDFSAPDFGRGRSERKEQRRDGSDQSFPPQKRGMLGDRPGDISGMRSDGPNSTRFQDRPPFQDGRPDRPPFQDGRPDRPPFEDGRPDRPPFQDGRRDRPLLQDGRPDRPPLLDGRPDRPPFQDGRPDRPPFQDGRSGLPPFQDGRQDRPPFQDRSSFEDSRSNRPEFQDGRSDRPSFRDGRSDAPPFPGGPQPPAPHQFQDGRPGERPPFNSNDTGPSGAGNRFGPDTRGQRGWNEGMPQGDRPVNRFEKFFENSSKPEPPSGPTIPPLMEQSVTVPVWGRNIPSNRPSQQAEPVIPSGRCMLLTNLPKDVSFRDVRRFFNVEVPRHGLKFVQNEKGDRIGTAYIRFATVADCQQALKDNKIASRDPTIIFKHCSEQEFELAIEAVDDSKPPGPDKPPESKERPEKRGRSKEGDRDRDRDRRDRRDRERDERRRSRSRSPRRGSRDRRDRDREERRGDRRDDRNRSDRDRRRREDENRDSKTRTEDPKELCLSVRNLPPKLKIQDILDFFSGLKLIKNSVYIEYDAKGTAVGPAYMEFSDKDDFKKALTYNKKLLSSRFVDVEPMSRKEIEVRVKEHKRSLTGKSGGKSDNKEEESNGKGVEAMDIDDSPAPPTLIESDGPPPIDGPFVDNISSSEPRGPEVVRGPPDPLPREPITSPVVGDPGLCVSINGLLPGATPEDIANWFEGVRIVPGSIKIDPVRISRAILYVETPEDLGKALAKHKQFMGKRFISVWHWKGSAPLLDDPARGDRPPTRPEPSGPVDRHAPPHPGDGPPSRFDGGRVNRMGSEPQRGPLGTGGRPDEPRSNFVEEPNGPPEQFAPGGPPNRFDGPPRRFDGHEREMPPNRFDQPFDGPARFEDRDDFRTGERNHRRSRFDDDRGERPGRRSRFDEEPRDRPSRFDEGRPPPPRFDEDRRAPRFEEGRPPPRYDERRRPSRFDDGGPPPRFDDGRPPPRFEDGRPPPRFDDGRPPPRFEDGRPPPRFDDGRPPPRFDDGRPDNRFDDHRDRGSPQQEYGPGDDFELGPPPPGGFERHGPPRHRDRPPGGRMDFDLPPPRPPMDFPEHMDGPPGPMDAPPRPMNFNGPPGRFGPPGGRGMDFGRDRARQTGPPGFFRHGDQHGILPAPGMRGPPPPPLRMPMGGPEPPQSKHPPAFMPGEAPPPETFIGETNDLPESFYTAGFIPVKISRLPYKATGLELNTFFSDFNPVEDTALMRLTPDGRYTGEGVIAFQTMEEAQKAVAELDGKIFGKKPMKCMIVQL